MRWAWAAFLWVAWMVFFMAVLGWHPAMAAIVAIPCAALLTPIDMLVMALIHLIDGD